MKRLLITPLVLLAGLSAAVAGGDTETRRMIAVHTDELGLVELDLSDLQLGESRTVTTENGHVVDALVTAEGVELYVDGELLEMPLPPAPPAAPAAPGYSWHTNSDHEVFIECQGEDEAACKENHVFVFSGDPDELHISGDGEHELHFSDAVTVERIVEENEDGQKIIIIRERHVAPEDEI